MKPFLPYLLFAVILLGCEQNEVAPKLSSPAGIQGIYKGDLKIIRNGVNKGTNSTTFVLTKDSLSYNYSLDGEQQVEKGKYISDTVLDVTNLKVNGNTYAMKVDSVSMTYTIESNLNLDSKKYSFTFTLKKK